MTIGGASFFDGANTTTVSGTTLASDKLQAPPTRSDDDAHRRRYTISVTYYQNGGGAEFELFAAATSASGVTTFNSNFHLVGDTANGGLAVTSVPFAGTGGTSASPIAAAIQDQRQVGRASGHSNGRHHVALFADHVQRGQSGVVDFADAADAIRFGLRRLSERRRNRQQQRAGIACLEFARRWNMRNSPVQATTFEDVDSSSFLNSGHDRPSDGDRQRTGHPDVDGVVDRPNVVRDAGACADSRLLRRGCIFLTSRRRAVYNTPSTWQPDLTFSVQHGFFSAPFQLTLTTTTPGATIRYTTDNSTPSATQRHVYTGPITISTTTDGPGTVDHQRRTTGVVSTESYIFLADVINQPAAPPGFPTMWGEDTNGNPQAANYAMNPANHPESALCGRIAARSAVAAHGFDRRPT